MSCNKKFRKSSSVGPCEFSSKVESKTLVENLKYFNSLKRKQDECKFDDEDRVIEVKIRKYELDVNKLFFKMRLIKYVYNSKFLF